MGFDLIGVNPKNETGEYFRNNVWWWRNLWAFTCQHTPGITEKDFNAGCFNDGYLIKGKKHWNMIKALKHALENKDKYKDWIEKNTTDLYPFSWENVEEFYAFILNNDGFRIC
jgi:hypothetical protein